MKYFNRIGEPWVSWAYSDSSTVRSAIRVIDRYARTGSVNVSVKARQTNHALQSDAVSWGKAQGELALLSQELKILKKESWIARRGWDKALAKLPMSNVGLPHSDSERMFQLEQEVRMWASRREVNRVRIEELQKCLLKLKDEEVNAAETWHQSRQLHLSTTDAMVHSGGMGAAPFVGMAFFSFTMIVAVLARMAGMSTLLVLVFVAAGCGLIACSSRVRWVSVVTIMCMVYSVSVWDAWVQVDEAYEVVLGYGEEVASTKNGEGDDPRLSGSTLPLIGLGLKEVCVFGEVSMSQELGEDVGIEDSPPQVGEQGVPAVLLGESSGAYTLWTAGANEKSVAIERRPIDGVRLVSPVSQGCGP